MPLLRKTCAVFQRDCIAACQATASGFHTQEWQLAKRVGDGTEHLVTSVSWPTTFRDNRRTRRSNPRLANKTKQTQGWNQLEIRDTRRTNQAQVAVPSAWRLSVVAPVGQASPDNSYERAPKVRHGAPSLTSGKAWPTIESQTKRSVPLPKVAERQEPSGKALAIRQALPDGLRRYRYLEIFQLSSVVPNLVNADFRDPAFQWCTLVG